MLKNKKVISMAIATIILLSSAITVQATPELNEAQKKYMELKSKEDAIHNKIEELNVIIEPLVVQVEENKRKVKEINKQIENTKIEIESTKKEIAEGEEVLSSRLRNMYKTGGQVNYISMIFSAESISDLFSKINIANKLVDMDKDMVNELTSKQKKLDEKVESLETKAAEVIALNNETEAKLKEMNGKIEEQNKLIAEAKAETSKYEKDVLVVEERAVVSGLIAVCYNQTSTISSLESAKQQLNVIKRTQLKTSVVINEVNKAIVNADELIKKKKAEEQQNNNNNNNNGGNTSGGGSGTGGGSNSGGSGSGGGGNSGGSGSGGGGNSGGSESGGGETNGSAQAVVNEAYKHLGKPYVWGATGPDSFDCSGLTSYVYRKATGINISRTTSTQINQGREVSRGELKPGDLVFTHPGHVGIYIGNGNMIHAPQTGDVVKVAPVYKFWRARRIIG